MEHLPSVRHLRHLIALADHAHFGRAAEAAFVTQSTLSASIKELENLLEATLVDRSKRTVVFTPLGVETVERARKIIADCEQLTRAVRTAREPLCGTLRLGAIPTISPFLLPRVLPDLRRAYSQLKLYLVEDQTAHLIEALHEGQTRRRAAGAALRLRSGRNPGAVRRSAAGRSADVASARQAQRRSTRIELADGSAAAEGRSLSARPCAVAPAAGRARDTDGFEATSLPTLVQMVDNGLGTTLLPTLAVDAGLLHGTDIVIRPLRSDAATAQDRHGLAARHRRSAEFKLLAEEMLKRASPDRRGRSAEDGLSRSLRPTADFLSQPAQAPSRSLRTGHASSI